MPEVSSADERPKRRILVVDDDEVVREMLVRVLRGDGYEASAVADGDCAIAKVQSFSFDLVLLDLGMPGKDGWKTYRELQRLRPHQEIFIITAKPNQRALADAAGAAGLFEKPIVFSELLTAIERLRLDSPRLQK